MSEDQVRYELHGVELTDRQREKMSLKLNKLFKFDASVSTVDVNIRGIGEPARSVSVEIRMNAKGDFFASKESPTFEEALDGVLEALHRQLEKRSGKRIQNRGAEVNE